MNYNIRQLLSIDSPQSENDSICLDWQSRSDHRNDSHPASPRICRSWFMESDRSGSQLDRSDGIAQANPIAIAASHFKSECSFSAVTRSQAFGTRSGDFCKKTLPFGTRSRDFHKRTPPFGTRSRVSSYRSSTFSSKTHEISTRSLSNTIRSGMILKDIEI